MADTMFNEPPKEKSFPTTAVAIAAVAIVLAAGVLIALSRKPKVDTNTIQATAPYASNLELTKIEMSEAAGLAAGKSTYIDGHVANHGAKIVSGITVQVLFANELLHDGSAKRPNLLSGADLSASHGCDGHESVLWTRFSGN